MRTLAQQEAQQEVSSMPDVIAQLNDNFNKLQSSYDVLFASSNGYTVALTQSMSELSVKCNTLIAERNVSLSMMNDLKSTITQYFDLDQIHMNEIQENLPVLP